jgi:hypothetical protein
MMDAPQATRPKDKSISFHDSEASLPNPMARMPSTAAPSEQTQQSKKGTMQRLRDHFALSLRERKTPKSAKSGGPLLEPKSAGEAPAKTQRQPSLIDSMMGLSKSKPRKSLSDLRGEAGKRSAEKELPSSQQKNLMN